MGTSGSGATEDLQITRDRDNQERYDTTAGGARISTGVPESLGKGGMIKILDDPHKTTEVENDTATTRDAVVRETTRKSGRPCSQQPDRIRRSSW